MENTKSKKRKKKTPPGCVADNSAYFCQNILLHVKYAVCKRDTVLRSGEVQRINFKRKALKSRKVRLPDGAFFQRLKQFQIYAPPSPAVDLCVVCVACNKPSP